MRADEFWMNKALQQAQLAGEKDEVPVGAVLVLDDEIIGIGHNNVIGLNDCTAHAEIQALRNAGQNLGNYRLVNSTLFVTLEPCLMCVGSLIHARIQRLVFGAFDPKTGAVSSMENGLQKPYHNHKIECTGGVMQDECSELLQQFFKRKRAK